MPKEFISSTNIGGRDDDELKPRIESEYTSEWQAIRKMMADYYSDKPFKDVNRFPAQILRVLLESDIKKDASLNNMAYGLPQNLTPQEGSVANAIKAIKGFAGFGDKRYKARVLDLDIALPAVESEGDKNLDPLATVPTDVNQAKIIRDNLLIDYIYTTEFIARDGISCDVGDIVIVSFDNKSNRTFGIIEHKISGPPTVSDTAEEPKTYNKPSSVDSGPPPAPPAALVGVENPVTIKFFADQQDLVKINIPEVVRTKRKNKSETVYNDSVTNSRINSLDPRFKQYVIQFVNNARKKGYPVVVADGFRSISQQAALYSQGRNGNPGSIVTNALPGDSAHQFGFGIDFYILNNNYELDFKYDAERTKKHNEAAQEAIALKLEWGGNWTSLKDMPHIEMPGWRETRNAWKKSVNYDVKNLSSLPNYSIPQAANGPTK